MGTNFYYHNQRPCPTCGKPENDAKHIGKSSVGWSFALHIYPDEGIHDLVDWCVRWWYGGTIMDEYGRSVTNDTMLAHILLRDPLARRSDIDGKRCVGRGRGTYDLHVGEFS